MDIQLLPNAVPLEPSEREILMQLLEFILAQSSKETRRDERLVSVNMSATEAQDCRNIMKKLEDMV